MAQAETIQSTFNGAGNGAAIGGVVIYLFLAQ